MKSISIAHSRGEWAVEFFDDDEHSTIYTQTGKSLREAVDKLPADIQAAIRHEIHRVHIATRFVRE